MPDSTTNRTETLDDWLTQWRTEGGWQARKAEVNALVTEVERLRTVIDGCGCPAPYDACTHDESLTKTIEWLSRGVERLRKENAALTSQLAEADEAVQELEAELEELQ